MIPLPILYLTQLALFPSLQEWGNLAKPLLRTATQVCKCTSLFNYQGKDVPWRRGAGCNTFPGVRGCTLQQDCGGLSFPALPCATTVALFTLSRRILPKFMKFCPGWTPSSQGKSQPGYTNK